MVPVCQFEASGAAITGSADFRIEENHRHKKRLHVLTLTPFFPSDDDDVEGCFIAEPLSWLEKEGISTRVIAVRPFHRGRIQSKSSTNLQRWVNYLALPGMAGLPLAGRALFLKLRAQIARVHASDPIDLMHAHAALPCGQAAMLLGRELNIPFIVSVHGRDVFSSRNGGVSASWCERASRSVYLSAARVICVSATVERELGDLPCQSQVIQNGVDATRFCPSLDTPEIPVVLSIGNLIPSKGHDVLLKAFAKINLKHSRARCQIVGIGPQEERLKKLSFDLGISEKVQFLGRQSREAVAKLLQRCIVFALPSSYEGLGCVYLEAMAAGKPAIGCRGQGIDGIIQSEINGWLVQRNDVEALARALDAILSSPDSMARLGTAARQTVVDNFTLRHHAQRMAQVYRECAS